MSAAPIAERHFICVAYADPILCGHATEARNLCAAAIAAGWRSAQILTYPESAFAGSGVALKPAAGIAPYADGVQVHRPAPMGDYKVLDGRYTHGMSAALIDLCAGLRGEVLILGLSLLPHAQLVQAALPSIRRINPGLAVVSACKAVGSDVTNVLRNAAVSGSCGAARLLLDGYLAHDLVLAVSAFAKQQMIDAAAQLDAATGGNDAPELQRRVAVSLPALDADAYLRLDKAPRRLAACLAARGLLANGYVLFLSRIAAPKGVDDLIAAYGESRCRGRWPLVIYGRGPQAAELEAAHADDPDVRFITDIQDAEKAALMRGARIFAFPSKPTPEFIETFGIVVVEKALAGGDGPIVCTDVGGIREASGGHRLHHRPGDRASLRAALDTAATMSLADRRALNARARAHALYCERARVFAALTAGGPRNRG